MPTSATSGIASRPRVKRGQRPEELKGTTSTATFSTGTLPQTDLSSETQSDGNRKRQRTRAHRVELRPVAALAEHPRLPLRIPLTPPLAHLLGPRPPSFPPLAHLLGPRPPVTPPMADLLGPIRSSTPALAHLLGLKAPCDPTTCTHLGAAPQVSGEKAALVVICIGRTPQRAEREAAR